MIFNSKSFIYNAAPACYDIKAFENDLFDIKKKH